MRTFRAMNTDVAVITSSDESRIAAAVERVFADAERRFSRFRADSELSQLNRADEPIAVSQPMFDALVRARDYVAMTGGMFDPGIGGTLAALGYDRSFAPGALDRDRDAEAPAAARFGDIVLDPVRREVRRPAGLQIDLGGMIKGHTVDEAAALLPQIGAIDAGGDAVMRGPHDWLVEIEDPRDAARILAFVRVRDRAVATSAATRRHWRVARAVRHHIVDPRTQRSAVTDLLQATVFAPTAELADVLAKTAFLLGTRAGRELIERRSDIGAVLVPHAGFPIVCGDLARSRDFELASFAREMVP
jgi:thiamine biosynthesis lipoprotein